MLEMAVIRTFENLTATRVKEGGRIVWTTQSCDTIYRYSARVGLAHKCLDPVRLQGLMTALNFDTDDHEVYQEMLTKTVGKITRDLTPANFPEALAVTKIADNQYRCVYKRYAVEQWPHTTNILKNRSAPAQNREYHLAVGSESVTTYMSPKSLISSIMEIRAAVDRSLTPAAAALVVAQTPIPATPSTPALPEPSFLPATTTPAATPLPTAAPAAPAAGFDIDVLVRGIADAVGLSVPGLLQHLAANVSDATTRISNNIRIGRHANAQVATLQGDVNKLQDKVGKLQAELQKSKNCTKAWKEHAGQLKQQVDAAFAAPLTPSATPEPILKRQAGSGRAPSRPESTPPATPYPSQSRSQTPASRQSTVVLDPPSGSEGGENEEDWPELERVESLKREDLGPLRVRFV
ncbi:hypothetical protein Tdes44962_MAKER08251 [Teratosphaeria destructans]|uniref:Uncharacterized protein n=1 Tax=Teratosphaeria destructans TaxID=418781 RepID=A0A9W7SX03_9PEZI|nr:hypothetical protein Tdes44962_MAKER08251 [Teratosphaeria destructans]